MLENYNKPLKIAEQLGDLSGKATQLNNIGEIYKTRGEYDRALEFLNESFEIFNALGKTRSAEVIKKNIISIIERKN